MQKLAWQHSLEYTEILIVILIIYLAANVLFGFVTSYNAFPKNQLFKRRNLLISDYFVSISMQIIL